MRTCRKQTASFLETIMKEIMTPPLFSVECKGRVSFSIHKVVVDQMPKKTSKQGLTEQCNLSVGGNKEGKERGEEESMRGDGGREEREVILLTAPFSNSCLGNLTVSI